MNKNHNKEEKAEAVKRSERWIALVSPTHKELKKISLSFNLPLDFLVDPLDIDERARIEADDDGNILIVIRIPVFDESEEIPFSTIPLGLILAKETVIAVCLRKNPILEDIIEASEDASDLTANRNRYVLKLFGKIVIQFLRQLKEINRRTDLVERELHGSLRNEELIKLLNIEKSLVFFTTSLSSNDIMFGKVLRGKILPLNEDERDLLEDTVIDNKQAIEMSNIYSNILSGLMDAFASVISNNLNLVMKFLTSFTIILMFTNLVAGIYGMNIDLPFQDSPYAFIYVVFASLVISLLTVLIFRRKRWL